MARTQAASFGGSNIDPKAWEDKKCPGESRFPAQVGIWSDIILNNSTEEAQPPRSLWWGKSTQIILPQN